MVILSIIARILGVAIGGAIFWGLGNLICYAFNIDFQVTYLMGLIVEFVYIILKEIFRTKEN